MIYGKIFGSMFEGSMVGAGSDVFAVMAYVISHMQPDSEGTEFVRLNAKLLSTSIGESEEDIARAIQYLCDPDEHSTTDGEDGRRLVQVEPFVYRVVNGKHYRAIVDEEDRRVKAARRQAVYRAKKASSATTVRPKRSKVSAAYQDKEKRFGEAVADGDEAKADEIAAEGLEKGE